MSNQGIFSLNQYLLHRDKAALKSQHSIYKYVTADLGERLFICNLPDKVSLLEFGGRGCGVENFVPKKLELDIKINADLSSEMLGRYGNDYGVKCSEEALPFNHEEFDAVVSNLHLHWSNNIPLALSNFYRVLKKNGVLIGAMIGGTSLRKLRDVFVEIEKDCDQVSYHISPMVKLDALPALMQRVGFKDVVVDSYIMRLEYPSFYLMLKSFQNMGESNCLTGKVSYLKKSILRKVEARYCGEFLVNGSVYCEIEVLNIIGYK